MCRVRGRMQFRRFFLKKTTFLENFFYCAIKLRTSAINLHQKTKTTGFGHRLRVLKPACGNGERVKTLSRKKFFEKMAHTDGGGRRLMRDTSKISLFFYFPPGGAGKNVFRTRQIDISSQTRHLSAWFFADEIHR